MYVFMTIYIYNIADTNKIDTNKYPYTSEIELPNNASLLTESTSLLMLKVGSSQIDLAIVSNCWQR